MSRPQRPVRKLAMGSVGAVLLALTSIAWDSEGRVPRRPPEPE